MAGDELHEGQTELDSPPERENAAERDNVVVGGGDAVDTSAQPAQPRAEAQQSQPRAVTLAPPTGAGDDELPELIDSEAMPQNTRTLAGTGVMPLHIRQVSEPDPEWHPDGAEDRQEVTSDQSDRVLRDRASLRRPDRLLNPVTLIARLLPTADAADAWSGDALLSELSMDEAPAWPGFVPQSEWECELTAFLTGATGNITGLSGEPARWTTPTSLDDILQKRIDDWLEWLAAYIREMQALKDFGAIVEATPEDIRQASLRSGST